MTKANAGSLLVFDASKIDLSSATDVTPSGDAVEGIVTERGDSSSQNCGLARLEDF